MPDASQRLTPPRARRAERRERAFAAASTADGVDAVDGDQLGLCGVAAALIAASR